MACDYGIHASGLSACTGCLKKSVSAVSVIQQQSASISPLAAGITDVESLRPGIARMFAAAEAKTDAVPPVSDEQPLGIRALGAAGRPAPVRHTQATVACAFHAASHCCSDPGALLHNAFAPHQAADLLTAMQRQLGDAFCTPCLPC